MTGDPPTLKVLWTLGEVSNERGDLYQQLFGNGVMTEHTLDAASGRLNRIQSGRLLGNSVANLTGSVQDLSFVFDSLGNLYERATSRTDLNGQAIEYTAEIFTYDDLNRLKTSNTFWDSLDIRSRSYDYDVLGNLTYRSDIGTLSYDQSNGAGVHAVTSANGQSYEYDAYGNMKKRGADTLEYDVFNKPTRIGSTYFSYGPDHERFKQVNGDRTTYYVGGGQYEEIVDNGVTTTKSYVGGYLVRNTSQGNTTLTYLHTDHLGSVEAMSDELGNFIGRMSFDPWGQRQEGDWEDGNSTGGDPDYYPTSRGYTGHEMLDQVNLVHMNGRVYDPLIGRFLSPDLYIQAPYNSQSYNRYSYVWNNPLSYTDPNGYFVLDLIFGGGGALVGLGVQVSYDLVSGQRSPWQNYVAAGVGGLAAGEAFLYSGGNPYIAGLAGGAVSNVVRQTLTDFSNFDAFSLIVDTGLGALLGRMVPANKIPGVTSGRNNFNAIFKQIRTKLRNGTISSVRAMTALKMFIGRMADKAMVQSAVFIAYYKNVMEMGFKLGDEIYSEFNEQMSLYSSDSDMMTNGSAWQSSSSSPPYSSGGYTGGGYDAYRNYTSPVDPAGPMWEWRMWDCDHCNGGSRGGSVEIKECPSNRPPGAQC